MVVEKPTNLFCIITGGSYISRIECRKLKGSDTWNFEQSRGKVMQLVHDIISMCIISMCFLIANDFIPFYSVSVLTVFQLKFCRIFPNFDQFGSFSSIFHIILFQDNVSFSFLLKSMLWLSGWETYKDKGILGYIIPPSFSL